MKVKAQVKVSNRGLSQFNMKVQGKASFSSLALGKKPAKDKSTQEVFLMHCTQTNRAGTKYNVIGNVEKVFHKFASEGKATIRLKEPAHDLCISESDPVTLKAFLSVLSKVLRGDEEEIKRLGMSALQPASRSQLTAPVKTLFIKERKDYPLKTGFPSSLESLSVIGVRFRKMDERIFKLKHLTTLNFVNADLKKIPEQLGLLDNLQGLDMSGNAIESVPHNLFRYGKLRKTLSTLILSKNHLSKLPEEIGLLERLQVLDVEDNRLSRLPLSLEKINPLTLIEVSENPLETLPVSLTYGGRTNLRLSGSPALFRNCKVVTKYEIGRAAGRERVVWCGWE